MNEAERDQQRRSFAERRSDGPRKVRGGIKLQKNFASEPGSPDQEPGLVQKWLGLISTKIEHQHMTAGLEYARAGQVVSMDVQAGLIDSRVQGTAARPYVTRLRLPVMNAEQWERIIQAMSAEAVYLAKLLANELPPAVDQLFASHDLAFMPSDPSGITLECTCLTGLRHEGCKHAAAVGYLIGEKLSQQPLLMFLLKGMPVERVVERLSQARTIQSRGVAAAHSDPLIPESQAPVAPLESCIDEFWRGSMRGMDSTGLDIAPPVEHVAHALLRRLGPSPMNGRFPMVGLLASVYDTVAASAKALRDQAERGKPAGDAVPPD